MTKKISHNFSDESLEAKARWFQSLSLEERMDLLCIYTDLILENNPNILEKKHAESVARGLRILRKESG
jgi:hypothetical protein